MGIIEKLENGGHKRSYETEHLYYEHSLQGKMSNTPIQQNFPVQNWVNDQEVIDHTTGKMSYLSATFTFFQPLLGFLNELRCHFEGIAEESERDMDCQL